MDLKNELQKAYSSAEIIEISSLGYENRNINLIKEHILNIILPDERVFKLICSKNDLLSLAIGHVFTQSLVKDPNNLKISLLDHSTSKETWVQILNKKGKPVHGKTSNSKDSKEEFFWQIRWIYELVKNFKNGAPLYDKTQSAHSATLMIDGKIIYTCEDLSRHNALDKAIGKALSNSIDLTKAILFISGRMPKDMMEKVLISEIPVIASNTVATQEGLNIAKENGITMIGRCKEDSMYIYNLGKNRCIDLKFE